MIKKIYETTILKKAESFIIKNPFNEEIFFLSSCFNSF